jgi:hypothetical protein
MARDASANPCARTARTHLMTTIAEAANDVVIAVAKWLYRLFQGSKALQMCVPRHAAKNISPRLFQFTSGFE